MPAIAVTMTPEHKFSVYTVGQKRRVNQQITLEFKRRAPGEPVIGHLKDKHRMEPKLLGQLKQRHHQRRPS
jgi:IS5 family transposase